MNEDALRKEYRRRYVIWWQATHQDSVKKSRRARDIIKKIRDLEKKTKRNRMIFTCKFRKRLGKNNIVDWSVINPIGEEIAKGHRNGIRLYDSLRDSLADANMVILQHGECLIHTDYDMPLVRAMKHGLQRSYVEVKQEDFNF